MRGRGADFGCGIGILSRAVLASAKVEQITLIDIDRRAIKPPNAISRIHACVFSGLTCGTKKPEMADLDFVVMNAPFHDAGTRTGRSRISFVGRAAEVLRKGGVCWLTANRHLPYEAAMKSLFKRVDLKAQTGGYKIYEAHK